MYYLAMSINHIYIYHETPGGRIKQFLDKWGRKQLLGPKKIALNMEKCNCFGLSFPNFTDFFPISADFFPN